MQNIGEEHTNDEYFIAVNGPEIGEADPVLKEALDIHWNNSKSGWHFTTNTLLKPWVWQ